MQIDFQLAESATLNQLSTVLVVEDITLADTDGALPEVESRDGQITIVPALMGDLNSDGRVNSQDAILLLRHLTDQQDLNAYYLQSADLNGNDTADIGDVVLILRTSVGLAKVMADRAPTMDWAEEGGKIRVWFSRAWGASFLLNHGGAELVCEQGGAIFCQPVEEGITRILLADERPLGSLILPLEGLAEELQASEIVLADGAGQIYHLPPRGLPPAYRLEANHPNPFNPQTAIPYTTAQTGPVSLVIYNLAGQRVRTLVSGQTTGGHHSVVRDGRTDAGRLVANGVYLYRLQAGAFAQTRSMVFVK